MGGWATEIGASRAAAGRLGVREKRVEEGSGWEAERRLSRASVGRLGGLIVAPSVF